MSNLTPLSRALLKRSLLAASLAFFCAPIAAAAVHQETQAPELLTEDAAHQVIPTTPSVMSALDVTETKDLIIEKLDRVLSDTLAIVGAVGDALGSNKTTITGEEKEQAQEAIRFYVHLLEDFRASLQLHVTASGQEVLLTLNRMAHLTQALIHHIHGIISGHFKDMSELDLGSAITRSYPMDAASNAADAIQALDATAEEVAQLNKDSENVGLSHFNRAYRVAHQLARDWHAKAVLKRVAIYSVLAGYILYAIPRGTKEIYGEELSQIDGLTRDQLRYKTHKKEYEEGLTTEQRKVLDGIRKNLKKDLASADDIEAVFSAYNKNHADFREGLKLEKNLEEKKRAIDAARSQLSLIPWIKDTIGDFLPVKSLGHTETTHEYEYDQPDSSPGPDGKTRKRVRTTETYGYSSIPQFWSNIIEFPVKVFFSIPVAQHILPFVTEDAKTVYKWAKQKAEDVHAYFRGNGPADTPQREASKPTTRFDDIIGREYHKQVLGKLVSYITDPERFKRAKCTVGQGYLLAGVPQTGKSLMAKALTGEIRAALEAKGIKREFQLFNVDGALVKQLGITELLRRARYYAPCVIFIDEIDLLGLQRDRNADLLNEFLTAMSGYMTNDIDNQVIILAATNKQENIDFALRENGRFGSTLWFDKPNYADRHAYLTRELQNRCVDLERFDIAKLSRETEGCSYGDLGEMVKSSLSSAKIDGQPISHAYFEKGIDDAIRAIMRIGNHLPTGEKRIVATHQAGAALATLLIGSRKHLAKTTILPIGKKLAEEGVWQRFAHQAENKGGHDKVGPNEQEAFEYGATFSYYGDNSAGFLTERDTQLQIQILLAGYVAQELALGSAAHNYRAHDLEEAAQLAKGLCLGGLNERLMAKAVREGKLAEANKLIERMKADVRTVLEPHRATIEAIAQALIEHETLTVEQVETIVRTGKLEPVADEMTTLRKAASAALAKKLGKFTVAKAA